MFRTLTAAVLSVTVVAPAFAAGEEAAGSATASSGQTVAKHIVWGGEIAADRSTVVGSLRRPSALPVLYASYAALQAYDVYSTRQALARGARETNPLVQGVVGHTGAFAAVKAAVGVGTIVAAERLWTSNKPAAIAVMVASNGVAAIVAARNMRTLRQLR